MASDEMDVDTYVHQKWCELTTDVENSVAEKWWNILKTRYSEESRKYHTFLHLKRMFNHMESLINDIKDKNAMFYAIFFHDAVYDAQSQENEEQSIKLFKEFAEESEICQNQDLVSQVRDLIYALKAHWSDQHRAVEGFGKDDVDYFRDFDISILGTEAIEYKKYTHQIREEYSFLPKEKYNFLRAKVLQQFLQIPYIYATQEFREKYEKQARTNIQSEIESLKSNTE